VARSPLPPLLYADTGTSADQLYFSRVGVHDPFIAFGVGRKRFTVQSALELGRVKKARTFDAVLPLEAWRARAEKRHPGRKVGPAEIIVELARAHRVKGFRVPDDFPAALFLKLRDLGLRLETANGPMFPEREIKTAAEAAAIREGNRLSALGYTVTEKILRAARIKGRQLIYEGRPLTSERLRFRHRVRHPGRRRTVGRHDCRRRRPSLRSARARPRPAPAQRAHHRRHLSPGGRHRLLR
jgi:Xaa-Pro aminopeptidase